MAESFSGTVEILGGDLIIKDSDGNIFVHIMADQGLMLIGGPNGTAMAFATRPIFGDPDGLPPAGSRFSLGNPGSNGTLTVRDNEGKSRIELDGSDKSITIMNSNKIDVFHFNSRSAVLNIGGPGSDGHIRVRDRNDKVRIDLDSSEGDIKLMGADCAEVFEARDPGTLTPGSVCIIGPDGALEPCREPYDSRVAGVVAGAGNLHPGIVLGQDTLSSKSVPLSLTGRAWCRVDADFALIRPGDLLTTSCTPGHAMRVVDVSRQAGAIIGKALAPLATGRGLVPVLVGLQ